MNKIIAKYGQQDLWWKHYEILPVPKPRQTKRDKWEQRPCVMRYRAFSDHVRLLNVELPHTGAHAIFIMPMPPSWGKKKTAAMDGQPHTQTPDVDNLGKALLDAVHEQDSMIWDIRFTKIWGVKGHLLIGTKSPS